MRRFDGTRAGTRRRGLLWMVALALTIAAVVVISRGVDTAALAVVWVRARTEPAALVAVLAVYGLAFVMRAWAWHRIVPSVSFGHGLAAIHLALAGNHVLPLRLGEALRVTSVSRRAGVDPSVATASTIALRGGDITALVVLGAVLGGGALVGLPVLGTVALVAVAVALTLGGGLWLRRLQRAGRLRLRVPGPGPLAAIAGAWPLEAIVVWQAAAWAGVALTPAEAVLVTVVTVGAQIAAVAPGGLGTYEAAGTVALVAVGVPVGTALAIAVAAHAMKTAYALVAGAVAAFVPTPTVIGRLRLHTAIDRWASSGPGPGPIVLFLPAHHEEATVATVVARCPTEIDGRPVHCLVIDDGSTDDTAGRASAAGADVITVTPNRGLGAAVRTGLAEGVLRDAAVVAFCDADGEYDPGELGRLVAPILAGEADYVVGTRFGGDIRRMLPHRRLGNLLLTAWTRWVSRTPLSDAQSGYRALSQRAAAAAEIEHDFNYAQVLTLDLVGRGARYAEVPISYGFREHGRSFVRLGRYLRAVVPAVWRTVNRVAPGPSVLDDVGGELLSR